MTRRETLVAMLERYREAQEAFGESSGPGDGSHVPMMSPLWNRSFRELERCLHRMRDERPSQYHHLGERYLRCQRRQKTLLFKAGEYMKPDGNRWVKLGPNEDVAVGFVTEGTRGKTSQTLGPADCVVVSWAGHVRRQKVERAVDWLVDVFDGDPFLPDAFLEAVA
jgi:hypothetical protein